MIRSSMQFINDTAFDYARAFCGKHECAGDEIACPHLLDRAQLDYSIDSLLILDDYLVELYRMTRRMPEMDTSLSVLWGGAYLGEVMRKHSARRFNWVDYREYMARFPRKRAVLPQTSTTQIFLLAHDLSFTLPLNRVWRSIEEGLEQETYFYAKSALAYLGPTPAKWR